MENFKFIILTDEQYEQINQKLLSINEFLKNITTHDQQQTEWLTSEEARKLLKVSRKTWQTYRDERRISFSQFGRKIYVRRSDLDIFMEKHKINVSNL